jgi:hypothetical protein
MVEIKDLIATAESRGTGPHDHLMKVSLYGEEIKPNEFSNLLLVMEDGEVEPSDRVRPMSVMVSGETLEECLEAALVQMADEWSPEKHIWCDDWAWLVMAVASRAGTIYEVADIVRLRERTAVVLDARELGRRARVADLAAGKGV